MKKIFLLNIIILISIYGFAQKPSNWSTATRNSVRMAIGVDTIATKLNGKVDISSGESLFNNVYSKTEITNYLAAKASLTGTETITNKRWTARVGNTTSSATPTINTDLYDIYKLTAQTADITSFTTNLSGTPTDGDILEIQITGTAARVIAWGTSFVSSTVTLPTTTVTTATLTVIFQYYATSSYGNSKWVCVNSF